MLARKFFRTFHQYAYNNNLNFNSKKQKLKDLVEI